MSDVIANLIEALPEVIMQPIAATEAQLNTLLDNERYSDDSYDFREALIKEGQYVIHRLFACYHWPHSNCDWAAIVSKAGKY